MSKLTIPQRKELRDLCKEAIIRKLSQKESHAFVNSKLEGFDISYDYVQKVRNEISKSAKSELLNLQKDRYALIQSLFFDRKDELEHMQKVLWNIIEKNQLNPDVQIKVVEKLQDISMNLVELYHSLPARVNFATDGRGYVSLDDMLKNNIDPKSAMSRIQMEQYDEKIQLRFEAEYNRVFPKKFDKIKKNNPELSDEEISLKVDEELEEELLEKDIFEIEEELDHSNNKNMLTK